MLCMVLLGAAPGRAEPPAGRLSLEQAIQKALAHSPNLASVREDRTAAGLQRHESQTYFLPSLSTSYSWQRDQDAKGNNSQPSGPSGAGSENTYAWSTTLTQPLFTGFRLSSAFRLADLGVDLAETQVRLAVLDVSLAVKEAFFDYLRAQKNEEVAQQALTRLTSHLKVAEEYHDVGNIPVNDVLKVRVQLAEAQQQAVYANNTTNMARSRLNTLLGLPVRGPLEVEDILGFHEVPVTYEQALAAARTRRPELKALDLRLSQADQSIINAQSYYFPQLSLQGAYTFTNEKPEMGDSDIYDPSGWHVITRLDWSLWEWGRTSSQVGQRRAQKRRVENARREAEEQVDLQVQQYHLALQDSSKNIATAKAAIISASENFRITLERFKEQMATNTEVLDAQTLLTQANNNYFNALASYNLAEARLLRTMGQGAPEDGPPPWVKPGGAAPVLHTPAPPPLSPPNGQP